MSALHKQHAQLLARLAGSGKCVILVLHFQIFCRQSGFKLLRLRFGQLLGLGGSQSLCGGNVAYLVAYGVPKGACKGCQADNAGYWRLCLCGNTRRQCGTQTVPQHKYACGVGFGQCGSLFECLHGIVGYLGVIINASPAHLGCSGTIHFGALVVANGGNAHVGKPLSQLGKGLVRPYGFIAVGRPAALHHHHYGYVSLGVVGQSERARQRHPIVIDNDVTLYGGSHAAYVAKQAA